MMDGMNMNAVESNLNLFEKSPRNDTHYCLVLSNFECKSSKKLLGTELDFLKYQLVQNLTTFHPLAD